LKQISLEGVNLELAEDTTAAEVPPVKDEPPAGDTPPDGETLEQ